MSFDLERHAPPGFPLLAEIKLYTAMYTLMLVFSLSFLIDCHNAHNNLYRFIGDGKFLKEGAVMPRFFELLGNRQDGFLVLAFCMTFLVVWHWAYYHWGSKPIYLMRRLPQRWLLLKQCITLPLLGAGLSLLTETVLTGIYALIYWLCTPQQCLPPQPFAMGGMML